MSWEHALDELERRKALGRQLGGPEKVERHRARGKLTVRERIDQVLDPDSFREIGSITGRAEYDDTGELGEFTPANFLFGRGRIDGRPVVIAGDDFTVRGGAADGSVSTKVEQCEQMAHELELPLVRLLVSGGGSLKSIENIGRTYVPANPSWHHVVTNLTQVPVVSLVLGSIGGISSARP